MFRNVLKFFRIRILWTLCFWVSSEPNMVNFTELNKEIVLLRGDVKRARLLLIQTLCRNIRKLRDKKGKPDQLARNKHRAEKLHEDITVLKGLKPDDVTKAGLFADLDEHKVLSNPASSSQDRAMARLISHKALKGKLDSVRAKFNIIPNQKMVSHMKKTLKDKQPGNKAKKTADKPEQEETGKRPAEKTGKTQTDSTVENTEQMSDVIAGQASSHGESSASAVGEEGEIRPNTDKTKASTESPSTVEIDVSTRNSESESEDDEDDSEEDADSEMEEISSQMTESPTESTTQSQANLSESRETNDQLSTKRTEPSTAKRKGPRKAACDAEEDEDEDEEEKEETTVTEEDDMFLREGDPDPGEDTDGTKTTPDSGGGLGVPLVARALPGESLFIGSLSGGRRGKHVKKGKFEKKMGKRPIERGSSQKFAARGRPQQPSRVPGAGKAMKPSSSDSPAHLHPSWAAKRKQKEQAGQIAAFQGKKIVFDD